MDPLQGALLGALDTVVTILFLPLQLVLVPIDLVLSNFKELSVLPQSLGAIVQFVSVWPSTLCHLVGASPVLFSLVFTTFLLYVGLVPVLNGLKRAWEWVRP